MKSGANPPSRARKHLDQQPCDEWNDNDKRNDAKPEDLRCGRQIALPVPIDLPRIKLSAGARISVINGHDFAVRQSRLSIANNGADRQGPIDEVTLRVRCILRNDSSERDGEPERTKADTDSPPAVEVTLQGLTRIRLHLAIYFHLPSREYSTKGCTMASV
jgi:hypothetical protein